MSARRPPCPACEIDAWQSTPLTALALGVALGALFPDVHAVSEIMCDAHALPWVRAMLTASIKMNEP